MYDEQIARSISAALMRICTHNTFFGSLVLHARIRASAEIATAATDGRDIFVNHAFFVQLSPAEREAVLLHEVLHAALRHVPRRGGRDPETWNIAADAVVNGMLARAGYQLPAGGIRRPAYEHLGVEEVYELLLRAGEPLPQTTLASDLLAEAPADAGAPAGGAPNAAQAARPESDAPAVQPGAEDAWEQALRQAQLVAESSSQGTIPAGMERELGILASGRLDWRSLLWRYLVRTPADFQGFDRRFVGQRMYLDALDIETVQVALAVDTSGSIHPDNLTGFVDEVRSILRSYPHLRATLYYADAQIYGPYRLSPHGAVPAPQGGGGTDFRPFFERVGRRGARDRADLAVYLTDGWGTFPAVTPLCPTMWVVTPGGRDERSFPFGRVVRMVDSGRPRGQPPAGWTAGQH